MYYVYVLRITYTLHYVLLVYLYMAADGKTPPTHPQGGGREHYVYM